MEAVRAEIVAEYTDPRHNWPWIVGFSGGKDSTLLLQLVIEAVRSLPPEDRRRPIHILNNDTLVESPPYAAFVHASIARLRRATPALNMPITVAVASPEVDQTFWVNLIGRGYPSPNRQFRWCTDRMKIGPTNAYIRSQVDQSGSVVLLLGVRKDESANRSQSINRHTVEGHRLNPHSSLRGCFVFRPIVDLAIDELWTFLLQSPPPWGGSHRDLVTLYRNASGGECPLVIDQEDAPSCGNNPSSRFGCWTCTVVEKDKSLQGLVDTGQDELQPLLDLRDWLRIIRNDLSLRDTERRNGADGPGPFRMEVREQILQRLLEVQSQVGQPLITDAEIRRIRELWTFDFGRWADKLHRPKSQERHE
jgi:DNA sulfur modification protein DndC